MQIAIKKLLLIAALLCFALVSCDTQSSCEMQMVAGGAQACEQGK